MSVLFMSAGSIHAQRDTSTAGYALYRCVNLIPGGLLQDITEIHCISASGYIIAVFLAEILNVTLGVVAPSVNV